MQRTKLRNELIFSLTKCEQKLLRRNERKMDKTCFLNKLDTKEDLNRKPKRQIVTRWEYVKYFSHMHVRKLCIY